MYLSIKRFCDMVISLFAIIILSPVMLIVALLVKATSEGGIIFRQERMGKCRSRFCIYKFRTMRTDAPKEAPTSMLKNADYYITPVGKFLRKTSLDELPQLFNILKGEMSFIGPRPVVAKEYELIELRELCGANDVLPGLSGWAQVNGRDELEAEAKASYDAQYVKKMSLAFDFEIFLRTIIYVLRSKGIQEGMSPKKEASESVIIASFPQMHKVRSEIGTEIHR